MSRCIRDSGIFGKVLKFRFWPVNFANWTIWSWQSGPGIPKSWFTNSPWLEWPPSTIERSRHPNLSSQYNCIMNLVCWVQSPVFTFFGGPKMDLFTEITDSQFLPNNRALSLFLAKLYSKFQKILGLVKAGGCHGHTYRQTYRGIL